MVEVILATWTQHLHLSYKGERERERGERERENNVVVVSWIMVVFFVVDVVSMVVKRERA